MKPIVQLSLASILMAGCSKMEKKESTLDKFNTKVSFAASTTGTDNILDYYTFVETPTNGTFGISGFSTGRSIKTTATANTNTDTLASLTPLGVNGMFYDNNQNPYFGGTVSFGALTLKPNPSSGNTYLVDTTASQTGLGSAMSSSGYIDYSVFNGKKIQINLNPVYGVTNSPTRGATDSIYVPKTIRMEKNSTLFYTDGMGSSILNIYSKNNNTILNWNADPENTNGVVIIIEYDPTLKFNTDYWAPQTPPESRHLYAALRVPDNGQYAFTPEDLQGLPTNCMAKFIIGRAMYKMVNDRDGFETYSVYTATAFTTLCRISQCRTTVLTPCPI